MNKKYQIALTEKSIIKDLSLVRHEDIRRKIQILPEFEVLIPPLQADEFYQLEQNILKEGCREALLIWETTIPLFPSENFPLFILIDGHNRYKICKKHDLDFKIHLVSFDSVEDAKHYMIDNQLGRRNLSLEQMSYLRGLQYLDEKQEKGKYDREDHKGQNVLYAEAPKESTSERLAKRYNVSEKTIKRDAEFTSGLEKLTPPLRLEILSGKSTIKKADIQQLSKIDTITSPIESHEEILKLTHKTITPVNVSDELSKLKIELQILTQKLINKDKNLTKLCTEIEICIQKIKALV